MSEITEGTVLVLCYKDGVLSRLGHDLQLHLDRFCVKVDGGAVDATFRADSFVVDGAVRHGRLDPSELSAGNRQEILDNLARKVLGTRRHPEVRFKGKAVERGEGKYRLSGPLSLAGREGKLDVDVRVEDGRVRGEVTFAPSRWGVAPFKAMLGALRVQDRVTVKIDLPAPEQPT